jgi:hypothetical protein
MKDPKTDVAAAPPSCQKRISPWNGYNPNHYLIKIIITKIIMRSLSLVSTHDASSNETNTSTVRDYPRQITVRFVGTFLEVLLDARVRIFLSILESSCYYAKSVTSR